MTCDHARCTAPATVRCRFGDGTFRTTPNARHVERQTFVRYCDPHFQHVASLFHLCDIALEDRPNGPLQVTLPGRHPELVARLSL